MQSGLLGPGADAKRRCLWRVRRGAGSRHRRRRRMIVRHPGARRIALRAPPCRRHGARVPLKRFEASCLFGLCAPALLCGSVSFGISDAADVKHRFVHNCPVVIDRAEDLINKTDNCVHSLHMNAWASNLLDPSLRETCASGCRKSCTMCGGRAARAFAKHEHAPHHTHAHPVHARM